MVYGEIGKWLKFYKSGAIPKAFKAELRQGCVEGTCVLVTMAGDSQLDKLGGGADFQLFFRES